MRSLLAVQAQDHPGALWAVGLRSGATAAEVEAAHSSGAIVRSWPMRGTLHLVAAEDLTWMLSLTSECTVRKAAGGHRQLGLDEASFATAAAVAHYLLGGGRRADRSELLAQFERAGLRTEGQRGVHLLGYLAYTGLTVLCTRTEYALLDEHVPATIRRTPLEAAAELALRYFTGHGPATVRDLAWWSGLPLTLMREVTERVHDRLERIEVDGIEYLMRPGLRPEADGVHLLPAYDEYLVGYEDRTAAIPPGGVGGVIGRDNPIFSPTIVTRGRVVGTWARTPRSTASLRLRRARR